MNSITLTASQAKEIVENRRLELFSPCDEIALRDVEFVRIIGNTVWYRRDHGYLGERLLDLTPPHQIGDVVLVKEPCIVEDESQHASFLVMNAYNMPSGKWRNCIAEEMPDWAVRTKAKAIEIELQLHEGKLRWREVWEVVE